MVKTTKILKALANEKRLEILNLLEKREMNVSEIAKLVRLHFKSVSKHLQKLAEAGLLNRTQKGFRVEYGLKKEIKQLVNLLKKIK